MINAQVSIIDGVQGSTKMVLDCTLWFLEAVARATKGVKHGVESLYNQIIAHLYMALAMNLL
jgi:hypothetical protein